MKAKLLIVMSCIFMLGGCCIAPIQGTVDFGTCSSGDCQQSSSSESQCGGSCGTSSYPDTHSYCGDSCNSRGCTSFFGNVGGTDPFAPGGN